MQLLVAALALLAVAACSTSPSPRTDTNPADSTGSPTETSEPEAPATASPPSMTEPAGEQAPDQTATQPDTPPAREPKPEPEAGTETEPETVAASPPDISESDPTEAEQTRPDPSEPAPSTRPAPPQAENVLLAGRIVLDVSQVDAVDADSIRDTVIYFKPTGTSMSVAPRNFEITTRRKRLTPDVLVVPVGSTVAFPNEDDILHNVFSVSSAANFDLGLYGEGMSKAHTFVEPGLAVVHCNVHHAMRADVLVVDTPFFAQADSDGGFSIDGIEPTAGELVAWHPRAGFLRRQIDLSNAGPLELELTLTRPRIPDHMDKTGQPYRPERPSDR